MTLRHFAASVFLALSLGCGMPEALRPPVRTQRLPSGRSVQITSCILVWGSEHDQRYPDQDAFALEYVSPALSSSPQELDREALEVFELIRPVSEQWGFSTASVAAFPSIERTGKYEIYGFTRAASGKWSFTRSSAKVFNTESGRKE